MSIAYIVTVPVDFKLEHIFKGREEIDDFLIHNNIIGTCLDYYLKEIKDNLFIRSSKRYNNQILFRFFRRFFRKNELVLGTIETKEEYDMFINIDYIDIKDRTRNHIQLEDLIHSIKVD